MSKYEPLEAYLNRQKADTIMMSFSDIEKVIGSPLPPSARTHRPWWGNTASGHVNALAWLRAGYRTSQVDMEGERLRFRKIHPDEMKKAVPKHDAPAQSEQPPARPRRFGLFGRLANSVKLRGWDLTKPTGERWNADSDQ